MKKNKTCLAEVCLCIAVVLVTIISSDKGNASDFTASGYTLARQIQYSFTIQNRTNRAITHAVFHAHAPVKQTPTQLCTGVKSSHPHRLLTDPLGNQTLQFSFNAIAPHAAKIITIKATLLLSVRPIPMACDDFSSFLMPEVHIESDHPDMTCLADRLKAADSLQTAENIFNWVGSNVRYTGYMSRDRGALYALSRQEGDCTEFMDLFVSLCRAGKIPARCIGGYICRQNSVLKPAGYHNWAEFYETGTWRIADPQTRAFMQHQADYIAMRVIKSSSDSTIAQFNRFGIEGTGLIVKMNS